MVIKVLNLDECIKKVVGMSQIDDRTSAVIYTKDVEYAIYQEYGFNVRRKDGSVRAVAGKGFMGGALALHENEITKGLTNYIVKQHKQGKGLRLKPYIQEAARKVQRTAKIYSPVDTGRLRASITEETTSELVKK